MFFLCKKEEFVDDSEVWQYIIDGFISGNYFPAIGSHCNIPCQLQLYCKK